jgi:hypothetical protein
VRGPTPPAAAPQPEGDPTVPLHGRLLYQDHRRHSRAADRQDLHGEPGRGQRDRDAHHQRYLGAHYMVVDVYEQDRSRGPGCTPLEQVGEAAVGPDGRFHLQVPTTDRCQDDDAPHYVLRARTQYCDETLCFLIGKAADTPYALWYGARDAVPQTPEGYDAGDLIFSPRLRDKRNEWSRAANHYASLVDAIVTLHVRGPIPFRLDAYGPLWVRFPSWQSSGRATRADLIDANNKGWPKGGLLMHEYGHIVHRRAWGGDYAGHSDPIQAWSARQDSVEEPFIAFKEGWANFTTRVITERCARPKFDQNPALPSMTSDYPGNHFPENHVRVLCDWIDTRDDRREGAVGEGDVFSDSLEALWTALDLADDRRAEYPSHDPVSEGLDVCDVFTTYLDIMNPPEQIGEQAHRRLVWQVSSLLENNDLSCTTIPLPKTQLHHELGVMLYPSSDGVSVVVSNLHPFMPSPPDHLMVTQDGAYAIVQLNVPALSAGSSAVYALPPPPPDSRLEVRLQDPTGRDTTPANNVTTWTTPNH